MLIYQAFKLDMPSSQNTHSDHIAEGDLSLSVTAVRHFRGTIPHARSANYRPVR